MNPRRTFQILAVVLVFLQLATVRPDLSVPVHTHGALGRAVETIERVVRLETRTVEYVSEQTAHDGSIVFVGDVLLARNVEHLMLRNQPSYPYDGLSFEDLDQTPYVVGNFEAAVPRQHRPTPMNMIDFSVDQRFLPALRQAGFSHLSLANNHSLDFGYDDFEHTKRTLEEQGFDWLGHPNELDQESIRFLDVEGVKIALIAVHTLTKLPNVSELNKVLTYAEERSDRQVVYVHWGSEYSPTHNGRQADVAERMIDAGADLIIGHHPHVVQDIDLIDGVPVFYSLGNYIFDQYDSSATQEGLVLRYDPLADTVDLVPIESYTTLSQPRWMITNDHARFLDGLADRSHPELQDAIRSGTIFLSMTVASSGKMAMMSE